MLEAPRATTPPRAGTGAELRDRRAAALQHARDHEQPVAGHVTAPTITPMAGKGFSCSDEGFAYDGGRVCHALHDTYTLIDGHVTAVSTRSHPHTGQRHAPLQRALDGRDHTRVVIVPRGANPPPAAMFDDQLTDAQVRERTRSNKHIWIGTVTSDSWRGAGYHIELNDSRRHQLHTAVEHAADRYRQRGRSHSDTQRAARELVDLATVCGTDRVELLLDSVTTSSWQADDLAAAVLRCRFDLPDMRDEAEATRPQLETLGGAAISHGLRHATRLARRLHIDRQDVTVHALARWVQRVTDTLDDTGIDDLADGDTWTAPHEGDTDTRLRRLTETVAAAAGDLDHIVDHIVDCLNDPDKHRGWLPATEQGRPGSVYVQIPAGDGKVANLVLERDRTRRDRFKIVTCYIPARSLDGRRITVDDSYGAWEQAYRRRKNTLRRNSDTRGENHLARIDQLLVNATEQAIATARS